MAMPETASAVSAPGSPATASRAAIVREPQSRVPARSVASIDSPVRLLSAMACSTESVPASRSTARSAYARASALWPANHSSRDWQRQASPTRTRSPSESQRSRARPTDSMDSSIRLVR